MAMQAGRKGVNPAEVNNRGFLRNVLRAMKLKITGNVITPDSDGYVNIPYASYNNAGVLKTAKGTYGTEIINGYLTSSGLTEGEYAVLQGSGFISKSTLETIKYNIITSVLTDTTTHIWTDTERLAVLSRLGCSVDSETGAVTWTAQE